MEKLKIKSKNLNKHQNLMVPHDCLPSICLIFCPTIYRSLTNPGRLAGSKLLLKTNCIHTERCLTSFHIQLRLLATHCVRRHVLSSRFKHLKMAPTSCCLKPASQEISSHLILQVSMRRATKWINRNSALICFCY